MKIAVIPDTQVNAESDTSHLRWAGEYLAKKKPDVIVHIGDHWDMPSLGVYDKGKIQAEGVRALSDIDAGIHGMEDLLNPIWEEKERLSRNRKTRWNPRLVYCLGNHEMRIKRYVDENPELEGLISLDNLRLKEFGWEVYDYLEPVLIENVLFSHYFVSGVMGRPVSSPQIMVRKKHMSCVMGHVQDRGVHEERRGDGKRIIGIFSGIFYQGDQEYLNPQTNGSWKGIWILHEVNNGEFDYMPVSIDYLKEKYGGLKK